MYGDRKKPYDPIEQLDLESSTGFKQLRVVAESVLQDILGPSVEEHEIRQAEDEVQQRRAHNQHILDRVAKGEMSEEEIENLGYRLYREEDIDHIGKVKEKVAARQHGTWLKERLTTKIHSHIDQILLRLVGIKQDYGRVEIERESVIGKKLTEMATKIAGDIAEHWALDNASIASGSIDAIDKLVEKARWQTSDGRWRDAVGLRWKDELEHAIAAAMKTRIQAIANERVKQINDDVFRDAVNNALLNKYPLLRKMEAAARLAAKNE